MKKKTTAVIIAIVMATAAAHAQKWSISTNIIDYLNFGTLNVAGSAAVARHWTVNVNTKFNPWTFNSKDGNIQRQNRQQSFSAGVRAYPWHIYSGWWFGSHLQYQEYNRGGILKKETEEGDAIGMGLSAGYSYMLHPHVNIEFGLGVWGGVKSYTRYSCPKCGLLTDSGTSFFLMPDSIAISIAFIF